MSTGPSSHIDKILAPVDLSASSEKSSFYALQLARAFGAEVVYLYVIPESSLSAKLFFPRTLPPETLPVDPDEGGGERLSPSEEQEAREKLDTFLRRLPLRGTRFSSLVDKGVPFLKILQAVETLRPDVVVQGTHGTSGLENRIIGGNATRVIRRTRCPVISVKPREFGSFLGRITEGMGLSGHAAAGEVAARESYQFPPKKILYPTDFSEPSRLAMDYAVDVAKRSRAELVVLHATDRDASEDGADGSPGAQAQMDDLVREMKALHCDLRITEWIVEGRPFPAILSAIVRDEMDMVVMGTHGRTGLRIMLSGSTTDRVIRNAPCPVLTVRPNWKSEAVEKRFRKVFRKLSPIDLQRISSEHQALIDDTLFQDPTAFRKTDRLLQFYSREGLYKGFEEYGFFDILRRKGFDDFRITFNLDDPYRQMVRIFHGGVESPDHLLIECVLREGDLHVRAEEGTSGRDETFPVLIIEWICLQNPRASFSPERPPLPGQEHPGLGVGHEVLEFLIAMGRRTKKGGIMNRPQFFHNGKFYHEKFKFYNPVREGQLIALMRDTGDHALTDVAWAIEKGCLFDRSTGEKVVWQSGNQVYPISEALTSYFRSRGYRDLMWETVANTRYRIDWDLFRRRMEAGVSPGGIEGGRIGFR